MSFLDEQAGERCHKRYKHGRTHLARKTSPEDNLLDLMRLSLAWSDIKMSHQEFLTNNKKRHAAGDSEFALMMTFYYADQKPLYDEEEYEQTSDPDSESDISGEFSSAESDDDF